jgi:hypothetical protein
MTEKRRYENIKMSIEIPTEGHIKANFEGCEYYIAYSNRMNICKHCPNRRLCEIVQEKMDELELLLNSNEEVKE